jgi:hypothetical protein
MTAAFARLGQESLAFLVFLPINLTARQALAEDFERRLAATIAPSWRRCCFPAAH